MPTTREKLFAYAVSALSVLAVAWPATRPLDADDFPLSTYPMFARPRDRVNEVASALAVAPDGSSAPVPPRLIANAEAMQAVSTLRRGLAAGPRAAAALCRAIAERLAGAREPELRRAAHVELVTARVDAIEYLAGRAEPHGRRLHARCDVRARVP